MRAARTGRRLPEQARAPDRRFRARRIQRHHRPAAGSQAGSGIEAVGRRRESSRRRGQHRRGRGHQSRRRAHRIHVHDGHAFHPALSAAAHALRRRDDHADHADWQYALSDAGKQGSARLDSQRILDLCARESRQGQLRLVRQRHHRAPCGRDAARPGQDRHRARALQGRGPSHG
ncbi:hypothetical protein D3C72_1482020 [compost metagenome]